MRAARGGRDIAHANRQKVADEDMLQSGTARILDEQSEGDVGARRADVGLAVLVTDILASWAWTSAEELEVTFWPFSGLPDTSTLLVRLWVPVMGPSIWATICNDLFSPDDSGTDIGPGDILASMRAARGGRDIAHANRQKVAHKDMLQSGTARILDDQSEGDVGARRADCGVGGLGDRDLRFLGLDIG